MQKLQSIMYLFCFLIIIFTMDLLFGNPLRETFKGINTTNTNIKQDTSLDYNMKSDDEPLNFGFSNQIMKP
jgi:hypothetical protein